VSVAHGQSCTHLNGVARSAIKFLIAISEKTGEVFVPDVAHPCRAGIGANTLTAAEVESFFDSCVKYIVFHCCFINLVDASYKLLNQVFTFSVKENATLYDAVRARCTNHKTTHKALLGLTNMSVSHSVATRASTSAKISAANTGRIVSEETSAKIEDNWDASLAKVAKFKEEEGHCYVPRDWEHDPKMANWVNTQRQQFSYRNQDKSSAMTDERIGKLKDIGFEMTVGKGKIKGKMKRKMKAKTAKAKAKIEDSSSDEDSENDSDGESASDSDSESDDSSSPDKENA
jgi:hypothetical protein